MSTALAVCACSGTTTMPDPPGQKVASSLERDTGPAVTAATLASLTRSNRAFAVDLYRQLMVEDGNLFVSPYSVSLALAMTYAGASGDTKTEMARTLHFDLGEPLLHQAFDALDLVLASRARIPDDGDDDGFRLSVINQLFGQVGFSFEQPFLDTLAVNYGAGLRLFDFSTDPEGARARINDWVAEASEQRIEELLPQGSIDTLTRLVLANAIYFQACWSLPFEPGDTTSDPFHLSGGEFIPVPTMHGELIGREVSGNGWTAVELPYLGKQLTMGLLVPDRGRFAEVEAGFDAAFFERVLAGLGRARIILAMPKFTFRSAYDLVPVLRALGLAGTDYSAMSSDAPLAITGIFHQAFVSVNEVGTEAAASTAMVVGATSAPPLVTLTVNRPFLFWIRDLPTGALLFAGRLTDPR